MILWCQLAIDASALGTWKLLLCWNACRLQWQCWLQLDSFEDAWESSTPWDALHLPGTGRYRTAFMGNIHPFCARPGRTPLSSQVHWILTFEWLTSQWSCLLEYYVTKTPDGEVYPSKMSCFHGKITPCYIMHLLWVCYTSAFYAFVCYINKPSATWSFLAMLVFDQAISKPFLGQTKKRPLISF